MPTEAAAAANATPAMRLKDRAEYRSKPAPLAMAADTTVADAVDAMNARNYGSVMVVDADGKVEGVVTERDVLRRIVGEKRPPETTKLADIMTRNPRVAQEDDDVIDWLRIMSNERFRRLPVVDDGGKVIAMMTQGDFVSYTWPDLLDQAKIAAQAAVGKNYPLGLVLGSVLVYSLVLVGILVTAV